MTTLKTSRAISDPKAVIAVYNTRPEAEAAMKELPSPRWQVDGLAVVLMEKSAE